MKEGRKLSDLAAELERQQASKRDFRAPTIKLEIVAAERPGGSLDPGVRMAIPTNGNFESFGIRETGHQQLASFTKIPMEYYRKMREEAPALLADNLNTWLHAGNEPRLIRTLDRNVRAFLSPRYRMIDNYDVASAALPAMKQAAMTVVSSEVTDSHLYLKATAERLRATIDTPFRRGQIVQAGLTLMNSEIGHGSVRVEPLLFILACLNGAIVQDQAVRKFHVGRHAGELDAAYEVFKDDTVRADDRAFMLKIRDAVGAALDEAKFKAIVDRAQQTGENALEIRPTAPLDQVVEVTAHQLKLSQDEGGMVLRRLIEDGDLSQWGLSNAITRVSQDVTDYDRATHLERLGGDVIMMPPADWSRLSEAVAAVAA